MRLALECMHILELLLGLTTMQHRITSYNVCYTKLLRGAELCRSDLIDISSLTSGEDVVIVSLSKTHLKRNTNYHLQIIPDSAYRNSYLAATIV